MHDNLLRGIPSYPSDWDDVSLGQVAEVNPEALGASTPGRYEFRYIDISSVEAKGVNWSSVATTRLALAPSRARRVLRPGDVLFCTVRPGLQSHAYADWGATNGYVGSTGFAVIRANRAHPRFLYHLVFGLAVSVQARRLEIGSNYPAVNETDVRRFRIPVPPPPEQGRIAEILDTADEAIRRTEELIAKLKAMKQGLLHDLLTRGLDEHGRLRDPVAHPEQFKDTPLGRLPASWDVAVMSSYVLSSAFGPRFPGDAYDAAGNVATLRTTDMNDEGAISYETMPRARLAPDAFREHFLRSGDLLISRSGTCGIAGVFGNHDIPVLPGAFLIRFRTACRERSEWLRRFFNASQGRRAVEVQAVGGVQKNVTGTAINGLTVPMPRPEELAGILGRIGLAEDHIRVEEQYLAKLKLQKKGLMHDLLTGRVRAKG